MSDKTIVQKMLIKPGHRFALLNAPDGYAQRMSDLPEDPVLETTLHGLADVIQCFITRKTQLEETLPALKAALTPQGILWMTYPKLTSKLAGDINRDTIYRYALTPGLQGVAMVAIDDDWSAPRAKIA